MFPLVIALVALVPTVTSTAAVVSGNQKPFCEKVLQGTYTPTQSNICPGGEWSNVFAIIKANQAQPK